MCSDHDSFFKSVVRKPEALVHIGAAKATGVQVIKRFTGGGTVVVDHNTTFSTLICNASDVEGVECYPRPVMQWSEGFYRPIFGPHGDFSLREHGETCVQNFIPHKVMSVLLIVSELPDKFAHIACLYQLRMLDGYMMMRVVCRLHIR